MPGPASLWEQENNVLYQIISHYSLPAVENVVLLYLNQGWRPQGGVSVAYNPEYPEEEKRTVYAQAIVKD
jgi:hypothetical protein